MSARPPLKVVAISDTHGLHRKLEVPDGDLLIHAGDLGTPGSWSGIDNFNDWMGSLPHQHKIVIAGNHDGLFQRHPEQARARLSNVTYLQDESWQWEGWTVYGSPWQPEFCDWAFNLPRGPALAEVWARIPEATDILVTHGPPAGILDLTDDGALAGCADLGRRIVAVRPQVHIFGHIHEGYGQYNDDHTCYINASVVDRRYRLSHPATVIDLT